MITEFLLLRFVRVLEVVNPKNRLELQMRCRLEKHQLRNVFIEIIPWSNNNADLVRLDTQQISNITGNNVPIKELNFGLDPFAIAMTLLPCLPLLRQILLFLRLFFIRKLNDLVRLYI